MLLSCMTCAVVLHTKIGRFGQVLMYYLQQNDSHLQIKVQHCTDGGKPSSRDVERRVGGSLTLRLKGPFAVSRPRQLSE